MDSGIFGVRVQGFLKGYPPLFIFALVEVVLPLGDSGQSAAGKAQSEDCNENGQSPDKPRGG